MITYITKRSIANLIFPYCHETKNNPGTFCELNSLLIHLAYSIVQRLSFLELGQAPGTLNDSLHYSSAGSPTHSLVLGKHPPGDLEEPIALTSNKAQGITLPLVSTSNLIKRPNF